MDMLGKIRRLRFRDGLSISEIVRRTGLSRNTVKSWLKAGEGTAPKYRRHESVTVLAPLRIPTRATQVARSPSHKRKSPLTRALSFAGQKRLFN